jgi:hypothetical protein
MENENEFLELSVTVVETVAAPIILLPRFETLEVW